MAQIDPEPNYDHRLAERVVAYLHTKDARIFPFSAQFDAAQRRAFIRDLREGLGEITDSGTARKTAATGFLMSDDRLHEIVEEWAAAGGGWPRGAHPGVADTALGSVASTDDGPEPGQRLDRGTTQLRQR